MNSETLPTAAQLSTGRLKQWHQNGEALLTFENLRSWINVAGLALYIPRHAQLPVPAPSMVEAVLGRPCAVPTLAELEQSRELLIRLIAEGIAVPLNLFGSPSGVGTDTPDFIVATAVLPYIFTLRGDKGWKLPPATAGAIKVSPLALNAYTLLAGRAKDPVPGMSASALASELGKEVTEGAVLRALTELWQHLRVLPIPQLDGAPTLWELTSARFIKQLKAGANAGQPTALSALISLYLGQSLLATEADIETFLSPLAARSRVRDVVHALLAARQLETLAIDGKTQLHVAGDLDGALSEPIKPLEIDMAVPVDDIDHLVVTTENTHTHVHQDGGSRIKKLIPRPRKIGTGFVTKPDLARPSRKPFGAERPDRERRPFNRDKSGPPTRPSQRFDKPWEEERLNRLAAAGAPSEVPQEGESTAGASFESNTRPAPRKPYTAKPSFAGKRNFSGGEKRSFSGGEKRSFSDGPKRSFGGGEKRGFGDGAKRSFSGGEKRSFGDGEKRSFSGGPKRSFGDGEKRSFSGGPKRSFSDGEKRGFGAKPGFKPRPRVESEQIGETERPRYRKFDAPRKPFGTSEGRKEGSSFKPRFGEGFKPRSAGYKSKSESGYKPRSESGYKGKSESGYKPRSESSYKGKSESGYKPRSESGYKPRSESGYKPRSESGYKGKPESGYKPRSESGYKPRSESGYQGKSDFKGKSAGFKPRSEGFEGKAKVYKGKPSADYKPRSSESPGRPFDKFKDNKKPFGKRAPARKFKPGKYNAG